MKNLDLSQGKLLEQDGELEVNMRDVQPSNGAPFCPYQDGFQIQKRNGRTLNIIRLLQPCSEKCAIHPVQGGSCSSAYIPKTDLKIS